MNDPFWHVRVVNRQDYSVKGSSERSIVSMRSWTKQNESCLNTHTDRHTHTHVVWPFLFLILTLTPQVYSSTAKRAFQTASIACAVTEFDLKRIKQIDSIVEMSQGGWEQQERTEVSLVHDLFCS